MEEAQGEGTVPLGTNGNLATTVHHAKASAWYYVAYTESIRPRGLAKPILSFPWVVGDYLIAIPRSIHGDLAKAEEAARTTSLVTAWDSASILGRQIVAAAIKILDEEVKASTVERLNFYTLLHGLLRGVGGKDRKMELSGSLKGLFHGPESDINVFLGVEEVELAGPVLTHLSKTFACQYRSGMIEYRGKPFSFTIFNRPAWHSPSATVREACRKQSFLMALLLVVLKWTRAQQLVRRAGSYGTQLSATQVALLLIENCRSAAAVIGKDGGNAGAATGENSVVSEDRAETEDGVFQVDAEMQRIDAIRQSLVCLSADKIGAVGRMALEFLEEMAFVPDSTDVPLLGNAEHLQLMREHSFRAYQLLAQSMRIEDLWQGTHSPDIELELMLTRRNPKLQRRGRHRDLSVFMDGASCWIFEGSKSLQDRVTFELYHFQRRPQHLTAQCYLPVLLDASMATTTASLNDLNWSGHVYQQYFAHFYRQLDLLRRLGSPDYGGVKFSLRLGSCYLTNLPRLFLEDGTAATVERVQRALALGYETVGDVTTKKLLSSKSAGFGVDLPRDDLGGEAEGGGATKEPSAAETAEDDAILAAMSDAAKENLVTGEQGDEADPLQFIKPVRVKKKAALTAMVGAFEPFLAHEGALGEFIERTGLRASEMCSAGVAVMLNLYNSSVEGNCGFQVLYDEQLRFLRMTYRPLRWMVLDLRGAEADGRDCRLTLTSVQEVDLQSLESCAPPVTGAMADPSEQAPPLASPSTIKEAIQRGVIEFVEGGDLAAAEDGTTTVPPGMVRLRAREEFRQIEKLMVRVSRKTSYSFAHHDQASLEQVLEGYPQLRKVPQDILRGLIILVTHVAEHSTVDPQSGLFASVCEKTEVALDWRPDWTRIQHDANFATSVIPAFWTLAHLLRQL